VFSRVALLLNANFEQEARRNTEEFRAAAFPLGITFEAVGVRGLYEFEQAFDKVVAMQLEALFCAPSALLFQDRIQLAKLAQERGLPLICFSHPFVDAGALMSYGPDNRAILRRGGAYIDRILRGATPAELPVEAPTHFELVLNLRTAKALGQFSPMLLELSPTAPASASVLNSPINGNCRSIASFDMRARFVVCSASLVANTAWHDLQWPPLCLLRSRPQSLREGTGSQSRVSGLLLRSP
jgi:hypothetical protein